MKSVTAFLALLLSSVIFLHASEGPLVFEGKEGPGKDYHVVLIAGDEEYRSEEALPQLAKILSEHHGFKCSVLFSVNEAGEIHPPSQSSLTYPETIDEADLLILSIRFRNWPDESMKYFKEAIDRGVPIIGLRTTTHAFNYPKDYEGPYKSYSFNDKDWEGGFGRQIMGETWVSHHGIHNKEGARSVVNEEEKDHPILTGVGEMFSPADVYGANPMEDSTILLYGAVTETMEPDSKNLEGKKNDPMQPIAWTREILVPAGSSQRIVTTTFGASEDLMDEDFRRFMANAVYWGLEIEDEIDPKSKVDLVGDFKPTHFGFNTYVKGVKPEDLK